MLDFSQNIGPRVTKKLLPWVETFWHAKKRYPTNGELSQFTGWTTDQLDLLHASKFYKECLKRRGIQRVEGFLTAEQVATISLITNFSDQRTTETKLASIGVTPEVLNGWYSNPTFQRELAARADATLDNLFPEAQAQLARQLKAGSFPALKFYYEVTGRAASPEAINLKAAINRLIDAVQKHVHDPKTLALIAAELKGVAPRAEPPAALTLEAQYHQFTKET